MELKDLLLIFIISLTLIYITFLLLRGKRIKVTIKKSNKFVAIVFFGILAGLIIYKNQNILGIITACVLLISGILYTYVPSGYDEKGIYINGRLYRYNKINEMNFDFVNGYYQLSFSYLGKFRILTCKKDEKDKLKGALDLYRAVNRR